MGWYIQGTERRKKTANQEYPGKLCSKNVGDKQQLKGFISTRCGLQEGLREFFMLNKKMLNNKMKAYESKNFNAKGKHKDRIFHYCNNDM